MSCAEAEYDWLHCVAETGALCKQQSTERKLVRERTQRSAVAMRNTCEMCATCYNSGSISAGQWPTIVHFNAGDISHISKTQTLNMLRRVGLSLHMLLLSWDSSL
jgi:hypothetical protein